MSLTIENKVALVTGANRGIGKAIVETFIENGAAKVYLAVRDTNSTKELEERYGDKVVTVKADLADKDTLYQLPKVAGDVDVLVNNAGVGKPCPTLGDSFADVLETTLQVNVYGLLHLAEAYADILAEKKGALVQLNSIASLKNFPHLSLYSASKAASYSLTQGLRSEFADRGISVLSVHPGPIDTDLADEAGFENAPPPSVVAEGIVKSLAAGDFHLFPDEMAQQFEAAYQPFRDQVVMAEPSED
ncbi:MAG: SDR family oxidoreductase [Verrucomicrobiota bacterium JB023]|nr:SDR family oxidoreductase [Verrucomicrobiota bacterium JB023]